MRKNWNALAVPSSISNWVNRTSVPQMPSGRRPLKLLMLVASDTVRREVYQNFKPAIRVTEFIQYAALTALRDQEGFTQRFVKELSRRRESFVLV